MELLTLPVAGSGHISRAVESSFFQHRFSDLFTGHVLSPFLRRAMLLGYFNVECGVAHVFMGTVKNVDAWIAPNDRFEQRLVRNRPRCHVDDLKDVKIPAVMRDVLG